MSGLSIRLKLWLKLWFTSLHAIVVMLLIPVAVYFIYMFESYRIASFTSIVYEKAATLLYVFIIQWCFSIDFDSKFYEQLITYPISRWKIIVERLLLSSLIFLGLLGIMTIVLTPFGGSMVWKGLLFSIPVYIGLGGLAVLATIIGSHSLGGLFAGLFFWILALNVGQLSLFLKDNQLMLYNRFLYFSLGGVLSWLAIMIFNRKSV